MKWGGDFWSSESVIITCENINLEKPLHTSIPYSGRQDLSRKAFYTFFSAAYKGFQT